MTVQPRILVVDDIIGSESDDALTMENRRVYCAALGLRDEASDEFRESDVAEAVFTSGQLRSVDGLKNSMDVVNTAFRQGWPTPEGRFWSAVIADMKFGEDERFGLQVIDLIHRIAPEVPIIVVSSLDQLRIRAGETLRDAAQRVGAQDFLSAPGVDRDIEPAYRSTPRNLEERLDALGLVPDQEQQVVGTSLAICLTLREIRTKIPQDVVNQILLLGSSGIGKSHFEGYVNREVARRQGKRTYRPASRVPLAGVAEEMQKKALFGTSGATGVPAGPGAFEDAREGGVVFLDEIGELGLGGQSDLLSPLQPIKSSDGLYYRPFSRMGSSREGRSRCFVLAATNRDLDQLVREGRFAEALLRRFDGKRILVPSLKERKADLPRLIEHFLNKTCDRYGIDVRPRLDVHSSTWEHYADRHSIRELDNHIEEVVSRNRFKTLLTEADFFTNRLVTPHSTPPSPAAPTTTSGTVSDLVALVESWNPDPRMPVDEFQEAYERLDVVFAKSKLRLWRDLVARQKAISRNAVNLLGTVKQLLGKDQKISNSTSGNLAKQIFKDAQIVERPSDPILAEIWDRRRRDRNGKE
jgi:DNA-binding NtrC family response regulator